MTVRVVFLDQTMGTSLPTISFTLLSFSYTCTQSELSCSDLNAFVSAHSLGISPAKLLSMFEKARAKRRDWRAEGRSMPRKVSSDESDEVGILSHACMRNRSSRSIKVGRLLLSCYFQDTWSACVLCFAIVLITNNLHDI